ncbi:hypothetical protein, partial [Secundilactobacillus malefermentans]
NLFLQFGTNAKNSSNADLQTALNDAVKAANIKTGSVITVAQQVQILTAAGANSITLRDGRTATLNTNSLRDLATKKDTPATISATYNVSGTATTKVVK